MCDFGDDKAALCLTIGIHQTNRDRKAREIRYARDLAKKYGYRLTKR